MYHLKKSKQSKPPRPFHSKTKQSGMIISTTPQANHFAPTFLAYCLVLLGSWSSLVLSRYKVHRALLWQESLSYSWLEPVGFDARMDYLFLHCLCDAEEKGQTKRIRISSRYFMREFYDNELEYFNSFWEKRYGKWLVDPLPLHRMRP